MQTITRAVHALRITTFATIGLSLGAVAGLTAGGVFGFRLGVAVATQDKHAPGCFTAYQPAQTDTGEPVLVPVELCAKKQGTRT